jgi:hypothetical protein
VTVSGRIVNHQRDLLRVSAEVGGFTVGLLALEFRLLGGRDDLGSLVILAETSVTGFCDFRSTSS